MPDPEPLADALSCWQKKQREQELIAREKLRDACNQLADLGVDKVVISYDGYGDSGTVESPIAYCGEDSFDLSDELKEVLTDTADANLPCGWEINDGAFGELTLDVQARKLTREHNWRVTEYQTEEEDIPL
ncbi:DUF6878 family protein [Thalassoglobus sp.]|uniref:DUF6878 family protein n=1 Tax=Thalassoglobus sp. TaxID=2795869 RepID=UPI003AA9ACFC